MLQLIEQVIRDNVNLTPIELKDKVSQILDRWVKIKSIYINYSLNVVGIVFEDTRTGEVLHKQFKCKGL